jgi:hypothetical protein
MDRGGSAPPPRSRSQSDVRGAGQVLNPDLAMYDNLRQRSNRYASPVCPLSPAKTEGVPHVGFSSWFY